MKDFYVVCCKCYQADAPEYTVQQHIKPVFDPNIAVSLCSEAANRGNMDEDFAVFHISMTGSIMIGQPVRGLAEL